MNFHSVHDHITELQNIFPDHQTNAEEQFFDIMRTYSLGKVKGESPLKIFLAHTLWGASAPLNGFAGAAQVGKFMDLQVQLIRDYNFHPFGRLMRLGDNWVIGPPTFLGTMDQISLKGFQGEFQDAYGAFVNKFKVGSRDDASSIFQVEVNMAKAMAVKDVDSDYPWNYPCNPKLSTISLNDLIKRAFDVDVTGKFYGRYSSAAAVITVYDKDNTETTGFMGDLIMLSKTYACNVKAYQSKELLYFPVLGTEPYFDFISDKMFIPYGFTMPPNFHPYVPGIFHHNAPALYFKIISEVYKMSTVKAFEPKKKEGDGAPIFKSIECFRGLVNPVSLSNSFDGH
ncbi:hypothetical protein MRX96_043554 [Rhipicephalus microplus]